MLLSSELGHVRLGWSAGFFGFPPPKLQYPEGFPCPGAYSQSPPQVSLFADVDLSEVAVPPGPFEVFFLPHLLRRRPPPGRGSVLFAGLLPHGGPPKRPCLNLALFPLVSALRPPFFPPPSVCLCLIWSHQQARPSVANRLCVSDPFFSSVA